MGTIRGSLRRSANQANEEVMCMALAEPECEYLEEPVPTLPFVAHAEAEV